MRHLTAIAATLLMSAGISLAADLPRPGPAFAPMPVRTGYDWTGFYLGVNAGGGWANTKSDFSLVGSPPFASAKNSLVGALGGVQLGYNWQRGPAVFGVETDFQFSSLSGRIDAPPCPAAICGVDVSASYSQKIPWFGTVRGRVGYAADSWLVYATAGYAYTRLQTDATATAGAVTANVSRDETRGGLAVGSGVELALSRHWSAKMEYLYIDMGKRDRSWLFSGLPTVNDSSRAYENLVRGGVNYRF